MSAGQTGLHSVPPNRLRTARLVMATVAACFSRQRWRPRTDRRHVLGGSLQANRRWQSYIVTDITIAPHGSTGWHWHRGEIRIVQAGTLTHYA
jgi:quercetin dioxygenase-like cupin family protein